MKVEFYNTSKSISVPGNISDSTEILLSMDSKSYNLTLHQYEMQRISDFIEIYKEVNNKFDKVRIEFNNQQFDFLFQNMSLSVMHDLGSFMYFYRAKEE